MSFLKMNRQHGQGQMKKMDTRTIVIAALVVVLVIAALYYFVFLKVSQTVVKAPAVANISKTGTIFSVNSQQYLISLAGSSTSTGIAYVHINKLPIFVNPLLNVTLTINNITKINAGTEYANMGIQLEAISGNSIRVKVSPLFTSLEIVPDSQYISTVDASLNPQGQPATQQPVTTVQTSVSTTATTASTTTISQASIIASDINATLKGDSLYALLLNFSALYANTSSCTQTRYNSLYIMLHGSAPNGPNDYSNVSAIVPYNMSYGISSIGNGNYNATFVTHSGKPFYDGVVAAFIEVNASTKTVLDQNVTGSGIFSGQGSISQLLANYQRASGYGACGVYV